MNALQGYKYLVKHPNQSLILVSEFNNTRLDCRSVINHFQFNHSLIELWVYNQVTNKWLIYETYNMQSFLQKYHTEEFNYRLYRVK